MTEPKYEAKIVRYVTVPPCFKSEPYGIYAGSPARLKKFRFPERIRSLLIDIAWWDMPYSWTKENNKYFLYDLLKGDSLELLQELKRKKLEWMANQKNCAA